ncbi:hypothetical protein TcWFU_009630 [Taenia crassiceps]|uniref:Uncharacterized protein n=1 Tax=Taenia crassiceps TaxID=6207 RepID=A0ABR4QTM7_9CEST
MPCPPTTLYTPLPSLTYTRHHRHLSLHAISFSTQRHSLLLRCSHPAYLLSHFTRHLLATPSVVVPHTTTASSLCYYPRCALLSPLGATSHPTATCHQQYAMLHTNHTVRITFPHTIKRYFSPPTRQPACRPAGLPDSPLKNPPTHPPMHNQSISQSLTPLIDVSIPTAKMHPHSSAWCTVSQLHPTLQL